MLPADCAHEKYRLTRLEKRARDPHCGNPNPSGRARVSLGLGHDHHSTPRYCCRLTQCNESPSGCNKRSGRLGLWPLHCGPTSPATQSNPVIVHIGTRIQIPSSRSQKMKISIFTRWFAVWLLASFCLSSAILSNGVSATGGRGDALANDPRLDMVRAIEARGPHPSLADPAKIFDRLVGRWDVEYTDFSK